MARTKRKKHIFSKIFVIVALLLLLYFARSVAEDINGTSKESEIVAIEVQQNSTLEEVSQILKENGIIKYPLAFQIVSKFNNNAGNLKFGIHEINKNMSYSQILDILSVSSNVNGITVVVPEGYELRQIAQRVEECGLCTSEQFLDECENGDFDYYFLSDIPRTENRLEGYLFPATYSFSSSVSVHEIVDAMLKKFDSVFSEEYQKRADELNMSIDEIITLASIIEREGANDDEFKTVSSVFHNRLEKNMKLESCATVQYILKTRKTVLSVSDTKIDSSYNTYLYSGLPAGPIASPGNAAIKAALYPDNSNYLYFLSNNGKTVFSRTFDEHQKAMKEAGL